ncbi:dapper homolog 2-like [Lethenteron reissneri]|uniref:dapper homolog 2-like n=1 Tax=Lethenteron reissneri TaxID=7753 RepID=UPI002AB60D95|nr:dapper homolog 2-like [Lethenteron reissneri]
MSVGVEVSRERVDGTPQDAAAPLSLPLSAAGAAPRLTAIRLESALAGIRHLESLKRRQGALVRAALHGPFAGQGHGQGQVQGGQGRPDSPPCPLGGRDWLYALLVGPHLARQHDPACGTAGSVQLLEQRFCELGLRGEGGPPAAAGSATPPAHPGGGGGDTDGGESPTASGGPAKISSPDGVSAESDSRASSGFYELSDAGTGSLSTSCNSVFSDLVPSPCLGSARGLPSLGPSRGSPAQGSPCPSQTITELQAAASERRPLSTGDLKRLAEEDVNGTSTAPDGKVRRSASEHGSVPAPPPPLSPPRLTVLDSAEPGAPSAHPAMTPDTRSHVHGTSEDTTERLDGFIRDLIERRGDGRRFKSPGKARPISTTASINGADRHLRHGKAQQSGASSVRGDAALPITKQQQQPTAQEATRTAPCDNGAGDDRRPGGSGAAEAVEGSLKEPRAHVADTMKVGCLAAPLPPLPPPPPPVMMAIPEEQQPPKAEKIVKFAKTSRCREPSGRAELHVNSEPRTDEGKGGRQAPAKRCRFSEDVEIIRDCRRAEGDSGGRRRRWRAARRAARSRTTASWGGMGAGRSRREKRPVGGRTSRPRRPERWPRPLQLPRPLRRP